MCSTFIVEPAHPIAARVTMVDMRSRRFCALLACAVISCGDDAGTASDGSSSGESSSSTSTGATTTLTGASVDDTSTSTAETSSGESSSGDSTSGDSTSSESTSGDSTSGASSSSDASSSESSSSDSSSSTGSDDSDGDGIGDDVDNCTLVPNPTQTDVDFDGTGDLCDDEIVDDGITLFVPAGELYVLDDFRCYDEVRIEGIVAVTRIADGGMGGLLLQAPRITIAAGALVDADAAGYLGGSPGSDVGGNGGAGLGAGCGGGPGDCVGQAGSGAGYGGQGGMPGDPLASGTACDLCSAATIASCSGTAGPIEGTDDQADIEIGSGGGAAGNSCGCMDSGGRGGHGGGGVGLIATELVHIDGTITANGETPPADASACGFRPGGGGGSGGGIAIVGPLIEGDAILSVRGGDGGSSPGDDLSTSGWGGGGGGGGRVKFFSPASSFAGTIDLAGGAGGAAPIEANSFAGLPGDDGTSHTDVAVPPEYGMLPCSN